MHFADLNRQGLKTLAGILQKLPNEDALDHGCRVLAGIATLPSDFRRPNVFSRLILPPQHAYIPLCALHRGLHAPIVHALFSLLALEVGVRINSLIAHSHRLNAEQREHITSLRRLHALWMTPADYQKTFLEPASASEWPYQKNGCEACMVARISGAPKILMVLRMVILSRTHALSEHFGKPRRQPLLYNWICAWVNRLAEKSGIDKEKIQQLTAASDADSVALKLVRKAIWADRRGARDVQFTKHAAIVHGVKATWSEPTEQYELSYDDFENSLIDHYAALTSTPYLPTRRATTTQPTKDTHMAKAVEEETEEVPLLLFPETDAEQDDATTEEVPIFLAAPSPINSQASSFFAPSTDTYVAPRADWTPPSSITTNPSRLPLKNWARLSRPYSSPAETPPTPPPKRLLTPHPDFEPVSPPISPLLERRPRTARNARAAAPPPPKTIPYRPPETFTRVSVADTSAWDSVVCDSEWDRESGQVDSDRETKWSFEMSTQEEKARRGRRRGR